MAEDYFKEAKEKLEDAIPSYDSPDFKKMRNNIRKQLQKRESECFLLVRGLKTLILGDWHTKAQKNKLNEIKNALLRKGLYAETIDNYYNLKKKGGLNQIQILETCITSHQLIVFIDGTGTGTLTEQNYLAENYIFHGKILFCIEESKFDRLKDDPSQYIKSFPTIIVYKKKELTNKVLAYAQLRIYRLASIIECQAKKGKGLKSQDYVPWKRRLGKS